LYYIALKVFYGRHGGVVSRAFTPSAEGRWFVPRSDHVKDWKNETRCFPG